MTAQDHNKTLVIVLSVIGTLWTMVLLATPWIIAKSFRDPEQMPTAVLVVAFVLIMAMLFWSTAIAMHLRKPVGRKLP